jgi:hypothetical protein
MARRRELPPLPEVMGAPLGPITVAVVDDLRDGEDVLFGLWEPDARRISVRSGLASELAWQTLLHEHTHAVLFDMAVKLDSDDEEAVCDAIGSARLLEMQGRAWTPRKRAPRRPKP